jgi:dTDP-4-dehydrorhamnose 3,5-epimerase
MFNDPALGIDWGLPADGLIISEKDQILPTLEDIKDSLQF